MAAGAAGTGAGRRLWVTRRRVCAATSSSASASAPSGSTSWTVMNSSTPVTFRLVPEPLCTGMYLSALQAAILMSRAVGEDPTLYVRLIEKGKAAMESRLYNGEYFQQITQPERAQRYLGFIGKEASPELRALVAAEGPIFQYGKGCLSDGMLGAWMAAMAGLDHPLDPEKVKSHLLSVHRYNLKSDLSRVANGTRPTYALGHEGGLLLCAWPRGGRPSVPFTFADEVWTGIEYQVASHLIHVGRVEEGLQIVRACRNRYDGRIRNPFDEYECGHWYARAMSSYALLESLSGARFDAVEKVLYLKRHHVTSEDPVITVVVDEAPYEAGLDPYNKLIDRVSDDNRKRVSVQ